MYLIKTMVYEDTYLAAGSGIVRPYDTFEEAVKDCTSSGRVVKVTLEGCKPSLAYRLAKKLGYPDPIPVDIDTVKAIIDYPLFANTFLNRVGIANKSVSDLRDSAKLISVVMEYFCREKGI